MRRLIEFGYDKFSQHGEDGVIEKIFELIGTTSKTCIEFGAWDGLYLSNTANLWTNGWKAVLIEGDPRRWKVLSENVKGRDCVCLQAYVQMNGENSLESLLKKAEIAFDVDLLSIDIDGDDYHILASLTELNARVIICEYNPTIPADIDLYAGYGNSFGASVSAINRIAEEKGYRLVALTETNGIYVRKDLFELFHEFETDLQKMRIDSSLRYLITSYSGEYVLSGSAPYGSTFPYDGVLVGECDRTILRGSTARLIHRMMRPIKAIVKRVLGRK